MNLVAAKCECDVSKNKDVQNCINSDFTNISRLATIL